MKTLQIDLALFGQKAAGKTVYAAALAHELRKKYSRRFYLRNTGIYVDDRIEELANGEWPSPTPMYSDEKVMFDIVKHDNTGCITFRTIDLPGEIITGLFSPSKDGIIWRNHARRKCKPYREYVQRICGLIDKSNAFMFLIDPMGHSKKNDRLTAEMAQDLMCAEIIDEIARRKEISSPDDMPPISFVFSKWDQYQNLFPDFEAYSRKALKLTLETHKNLLGPHRITNCSGVGRTKTTEIKDDDGKRIVHSPVSPIMPKGVTETLFWFISAALEKDSKQSGIES